jgi:hypothetical protein
MWWQPVFGSVYLVGGVLLAVFARPVAVWDYAIDLKWKLLLTLGLPFRVWFLRIGGILLALAGLFVLVIYLLTLWSAIAPS